MNRRPHLLTSVTHAERVVVVLTTLGTGMSRPWSWPAKDVPVCSPRPMAAPRDPGADTDQVHGSDRTAVG